MTTIKVTDLAPQWQTFNVVGGMISRTDAGQVEGMLRLASGVALTFMCDPDGSHWTWLPEEPKFVLLVDAVSHLAGRSRRMTTRTWRWGRRPL